MCIYIYIYIILSRAVEHCSATVERRSVEHMIPMVRHFMRLSCRKHLPTPPYTGPGSKGDVAAKWFQNGIAVLLI